MDMIWRMSNSRGASVLGFSFSMVAGHNVEHSEQNQRRCARFEFAQCRRSLMAGPTRMPRGKQHLWFGSIQLFLDFGRGLIRIKHVWSQRNVVGRAGEEALMGHVAVVIAGDGIGGW